MCLQVHWYALDAEVLFQSEYFGFIKVEHSGGKWGIFAVGLFLTKMWM